MYTVLFFLGMIPLYSVAAIQPADTAIGLTVAWIFVVLMLNIFGKKFWRFYDAREIKKARLKLGTK